LCPYALFGWTFFVPEDTDKTDAELLREAAKLASRADLRETRPPAARSKSSTPGRVKIPHHCDGEMDDYASA
jgi:hypothetical protein